MNLDVQFCIEAVIRSKIGLQSKKVSFVDIKGIPRYLTWKLPLENLKMLETVSLQLELAVAKNKLLF